MKRLGIFLLAAVLFAGTVFAQDRNNRQDRDNRQRNNRIVTIDGTLQLEKGFVAVASGDSVYYVPMLTRYIGFIEALKEGTQVSVEGYEFRKFIHPTKVTLAGKSYDFVAKDLPRVRGGDFGPGRGSDRDFRPGRNGFRHDRNFGPGRRQSRGGGCGWV